MESLLGASFGVFIGFTVCILGFAAYMTGLAVASTWGPVWHVVFYCILLGFADRFFTWGLFGGEGLSISGYVIDTLVLIAIGVVAFRFIQVRKMVTQYPWIYERTGPFSWREKR